jgi:hypothetical protein
MFDYKPLARKHSQQLWLALAQMVIEPMALQLS